MRVREHDKDSRNHQGKNDHLLSVIVVSQKEGCCHELVESYDHLKCSPFHGHREVRLHTGHSH